MIKKFTQFRGSSIPENKSKVFKPFDIVSPIDNEKSNGSPKKESKNKRSEKINPEVDRSAIEQIKEQESFIPINIPSFDKIIKDFQSSITPAEKDNEVEEIPDHQEKEYQEEIPDPIIEEPLIGYKIFRDKSETFECKISIEGANPQNSSVRLILDSNEWNLVFYGRIDSNGRCVIPLKKISILSEKCKGEIRLEVIAEDTLFIPWKESFVVVPSKKVTVEILSSGRNNSENSTIKVSGIKGQ